MASRPLPAGSQLRSDEPSELIFTNDNNIVLDSEQCKRPRACV